MGWLLEIVIDEFLSKLASKIHRSFGWVGCAIAVIAPVTMVALACWLLVRSTG